jgi:hypothetical protein
MSCLYPIHMLNPKYIGNRKNGGNVPIPLHPSLKHISVPCGNCFSCRKKRANDWSQRLREHIKHNANGKVVNLTLSNESFAELDLRIPEAIRGYKRENEIIKLAIKLFLDRWKFHHKGKSLNHWFITELGGTNTERIHIHGFVWTNETKEKIDKIWSYGYTRINDHTNGGYLNEASIGYAVKYVHKVDVIHKTYKSIVLASPGIGKNYIISHNASLNLFKGEETQETYISRTGAKTFLCPYYRKYLLTPEQGEQLRVIKDEKKIKYIAGSAIDVSTSEGLKRYENTREVYREKSQRLGFGTNKKDKGLMAYEEERREELRLKNIQNSKSTPLYFA